MKRAAIITAFIFATCSSVPRAPLTSSQQSGTGPVVVGLPMRASREDVQRIFAEAGQQPALQNPSDDLYVRPAVKLDNAGYTTVYFDDNRLAMISIKLCERLAFARQRECYDALHDRLRQRYGAPADDQWEVHPDYLGTHEEVAFKVGKAVAKATWKQRDLEIQLRVLTDHSGHLYIDLQYRDPDLWPHPRH